MIVRSTAAGHAHSARRAGGPNAPGAAPLLPAEPPAAHLAFRAQAARTPEATAISWAGPDVSYAALERRANGFAAAVRARGAGPDARVALCLTRTPDAVAALLGVMTAGAAYVPVDPTLPAERIAFLLRDSGASFIITDAAQRDRLPAFGGEVLMAEAVPDGGEAAPAEPHRDTLAYVIYTSGSTGLPKGVAVTHGALAGFVVGMAAFPGVSACDVVLATAPFSFDMSIAEVVLPLCLGARLVLVDRAEATDGARLAARIDAAGATVVQATPTAWRMLVAAGWRGGPHVRALCGGEAMTPELARLLAERCGEVWNLYGPTEITVWATAHRAVPDEAPVAIGRPLPRASAYVLDGALRPAPPGEAGDLYVGGWGMTRGYLERRALTADHFLPDPFAAAAGARMYRTGDRARVRGDGALVFLGRADDQLKIRGHRIEPGEVEAALESHPAVRLAAVLPRPDPAYDGDRLVAFVVPAGEPPTAAELRAHLRERLPAYMVPAAFAAMDAFPLTSTGKVDRKALPEDLPLLGEAARTDAAPEDATPVDAASAAVLAAWEEVLRPGRPLSADEDFVDLGGHSLAALRVLARIRETRGVDLPVSVLLEPCTARQLAARVEAAAPSGAAEAAPETTGRPAALPLSFGQQRLWFLHRMDPESPFYNVPAALRLAGALDEDALRRALAGLVARHESLRTTFAEGADGPVQVVAPPSAAFPLRVSDVRTLAPAAAEAAARRLAREEAATPFDLERGPLFRAVLVRLPGETHLLVLNVHHAVSDGWSLGVLYDDLAALYGEAAGLGPAVLPPLPLQYADFALWQRALLAGEAMQAQLAYWRRKLAGVPAVLELPADRPRPQRQSHRGAVVELQVPPPLTAALKRLAREEHATPFMVLLAAYAALLARIAGRDDLVIGSPIAGRVRPEVEGLIGFFVNTMALRADVTGAPTFRTLLRRIRETTLEAYAHQDLPFERVVEELHPERALSHTPLFQYAFALQNVEMEPRALPGLEIAAEVVDSGTSKFDLFLEMREQGGGIGGRLEYATDLWDAGSAERMAGQFVRLLEAAVHETDRPVAALALAGADARAALAAERGGRRTEYPRGASVHALFADEARRRPDATALVWDGGCLTYAALDAWASRIAGRLRAAGVGAEDRVALLAERSPEQVAAILGILKAGGAYLPINPAYPAARVRLMLEDGGVRAVVAQPALGALLAAADAELAVEWLDGAGAGAAAPGGAETWSGADMPPEGAAYVMYTSGSTGRPKGVVVPHRAVVRLVRGAGFARFGADEVWLQLAPAAFDASTLELWGALLNGGTAALHPAERPSVASLGAFIHRHGVTSAWLTAGLFHQMVDADPESLAGLRQLLAGGEALSVPHVARMLAAAPGVRLVNGYGPTENTTFSCCHTIAPADAARASIPIGVPIANSRAYVLDAAMEPAGIDEAAELYVGGDGLGRGYLGAPGLTAARYVPDAVSGERGARLYRTGDRVRWRPDGVLEFLGRIDQQVKVRGHRIEPGEVEAVLDRHPAVARALVDVRAEGDGERRLVAYVVPRRRTTAAPVADPAAEALAAADAGRHVEHWGALFDDVYSESRTDGDETLDLAGWNSSYTGAPMPACEMREWVDRTVARIRALAPRRVLELGVGTGLLYFGVAPGAERYVGTDFSGRALAALRVRIERSGLPLPTTELLEREADDFTGIPARGFDAAVLNSVSQYFPDAGYLVRVVERGVEAVADGGAFFIGDVRNRWTLEAFRAAVEIAAAPDGALVRDVRERVRRTVREEEELVVEPDFFPALAAALPRVAGAEPRLKRGVHHNELTRHRYDVTLRVGPRPPPAPAPAADWAGEALTVDALRTRLAAAPERPLAVMGVPNARVWREFRAAELLGGAEPRGTLRELRRRLDDLPDDSVDPEALWSLGEALGLEVEIRPAGHGAPDRMDALFRPAGAAADFPVRPPRTERPEALASDPLWGHHVRELVPLLRGWLEAELPEYMRPSAVVVLDALPLTPNGKVDRHALPDPEPVRLDDAAARILPRSDTERAMAALWTEVLRVDAVYGGDDFFSLGGHSLLAMQLVARMRDAFQVELPLGRIFEARTLEALSRAVDESRAETLDALLAGLEGLTDEEVAALLLAESPEPAGER